MAETEGVRIGIVLPTRGIVMAGGRPDTALLLQQAKLAEVSGLDSVWAGDSLIAKPRLEPLSVLAAVAACTSRVGLGTSVLLAGLRQPVLLAQTAATIDLLSGGRLVLAMGAGGAFTPEQQNEWRAAGVSEHHRGRRLGELVDVMQRLWAGEKVSFEGRHFRFENVSIGFKPAQSPRIRTLLACHYGEGREAQYRRAARLADGMMSITDSVEEFIAVRQMVLREVVALGRDPRGFGATYYLTVNLNDDAQVAQAEADSWIRRYYGLNFWGERWGPFGAAEAIVERARGYIEAGADELVFRFASDRQQEQLERFAAAVLPALRQLGRSASPA